MVFGEFREILFFREVEEMIAFETGLRARWEPDRSREGADAAWAETVRYIQSKIPDREAFLRRLDDYAQNGRPVWYAGRNPDCDDLSGSQLIRAYGNLFRGAEREQMLQNASWATHIQAYVDQVLANGDMLLELTIGAGVGTTAVAAQMTDRDFLTSVDIDLICAKNADGILRHFQKRGIGIAVSLWDLPFDDGTFSTVCSHFGVDECREIDTVLREAARVLKPGGRMVLASNESGYRRTKPYFDLYGIQRAEALELLRSVRHYADKAQLDGILARQGLQEIHFQSFGERVVTVYRKRSAE